MLDQQMQTAFETDDVEMLRACMNSRSEFNNTYYRDGRGCLRRVLAK
jgi:hypothetical protein